MASNRIRIKALNYEVIHGPDIWFGGGYRYRPLTVETPDFTLTVSWDSASKKDRAVFELKRDFSHFVEARELIDPYVKRWTIDATLKLGPGVFDLAYLDAEVEDESDYMLANEKLGYEGAHYSYPEPPGEAATAMLENWIQNYSPAQKPQTIALEGRATMKSSGGAGLSLSPEQPLPAARAIHLNWDAEKDTNADADPPTTTITVDYTMGIETGQELSLKDAPTFHLPNDWEATKRDLNARIDALESSLRDALPVIREADKARHAMGGNHPPSAIDDDSVDPPGNASDVVAGIRSIGDLRAQLALPTPDDPVLVLISRWAIERASKAALAALRWSIDLANSGIKAAVTGAGGAAGVAWVAQPEQMEALVTRISKEVGHLLSQLSTLF